MKILALETSTKNFGLAVSVDQKVVALRQIVLKKVLSSSIIPAIEQILKKAKINLKDLDGFAVGIGPGSFTSLRVGLSTIKAMAMSLDKPVVGISSLDVLAMNCADEGRQVCAFNDARRKLVYACLYRFSGGQLERVGKHALAAPDDFLTTIGKDTIFVGDAIPLFKENILKAAESSGWKASFAEEKLWAPQAKQLIQLAWPRFAKRKFDHADTIVPLYLYPENCQVGK